jgi:hypothetical protein
LSKLIVRQFDQVFGTAQWAYDPATDTFKPSQLHRAECGFACHTKVSAQDYILAGLHFHGISKKVNGEFLDDFAWPTKHRRLNGVVTLNL